MATAGRRKSRAARVAEETGAEAQPFAVPEPVKPEPVPLQSGARWVRELDGRPVVSQCPGGGNHSVTRHGRTESGLIIYRCDECGFEPGG